MKKAVLFSFRDGILRERIGFIDRVNQYRSIFYELKFEEDKSIGMIKHTRRKDPVIVNSKPGIIHNNFIWFPVEDDESFNENAYTIKAAEIFRAKVERDIRKKDKELNNLYLAGAYLNEILI